MAHESVSGRKVEIEIDGTVYEIYLLDALAGYRLCTRLLKVAGDALEAGGKLSGEGASLALGTIGAVLKAIPADLLEELRSKFAEHSCVEIADGQRPRVSKVFGTHFAGRYAHMLKWMAECVRVNFADFLEGELFVALKKKLEDLDKTSSQPSPPKN